MNARTKVIVVEDEGLVAATLEIALDANGYDVVGAVATLDEAMILLDTTQPDIALIDYRLARSTTEALVSALRARHIPCCVLTGYEPALLPAAYTNCAVLEKPVRVAALIRAMQGLRVV